MEGPQAEMILQRVANFLNSEFGNDLQSISKAKELYDQLNSTRISLEQQLSYASNEAPSKIDEAVTDGEETTAKIATFVEDQQQIAHDIDNYMADTVNLVKKLTALTTQIKELERYSDYLQLIAFVEDLSSDIQSALIINSIERSVTQFSEMAELAKSIQESNCRHLVYFTNQTVVFWYKILKEKFSSEFDEVLHAWRWPFIVSTSKSQPIQNVTEVKAKLDSLFNHLLLLHLPDGLSSEGQPSHPVILNLPGWRPPLLPLQLMLKSLKKRFRYHFYGNKQTNSRDKPEWYFTQTLTWIKDHREFLVSKIQPILNKAGLKHVDAVVEFSRGLVILVMEKLLTDIPELLYDDHLFSHMVDEALAFDKELRYNYGYPLGQPGVLHVLTQDEPFDKWIYIEKKFAHEKMDTMLSSATAWQSQYRDMSVKGDDMKVPECGESFMTLMLTITERYKPLPYPTHRLKFLDLQLELLDDFRIRMLQVKNEETSNPLGQCYCAILNTINYIIEVLKDWSEVVFFVQLQYYRAQHASFHIENPADLQENSSDRSKEPSPMTSLTRAVQRATMLTSPARESPDSAISTEPIDESKMDTLEGTVFDEMIKLFEHMKNEMLTNNIVSYVCDDVKARSRPYRKDKWLTLPSQKEYASLALSNSACEMLLVLKDRLHQVHQLLSKPLFETFWQKVAEILNSFIYRELILTNHFNEGGAAQLQFDMTRNLFPLFGQYTQKPENFFKDVKEACMILTINVGSAILLKEVLYQALHEPNTDTRVKVADPMAALHDLGVFKLDPNQAELVLSLRTNISHS